MVMGEITKYNVFTKNKNNMTPKEISILSKKEMMFNDEEMDKIHLILDIIEEKFVKDLEKKSYRDYESRKNNYFFGHKHYFKKGSELSFNYKKLMHRPNKYIIEDLIRSKIESMGWDIILPYSFDRLVFNDKMYWFSVEFTFRRTKGQKNRTTIVIDKILNLFK